MSVRVRCRPPSAAAASYLAVGAVVVAALIGAYVLIGTPGLHRPVANAPGASRQPIDVRAAACAIDTGYALISRSKRRRYSRACA